jgi:hypothetical protein
MPLCPVNVAGPGLADPDTARADLSRALRTADRAAPVIVLIHGYKHSPYIPAHDPHGHILSLAPRKCWKAVSWPRLLGLGAGGGLVDRSAVGRGGTGPEPVCIALGWEGRGTIWQAYRRASAAGEALAAIVRQIRAERPGADVSVLAHSLGARVALSALPRLDPGSLGRAVLLAGAEMQSRAGSALDTPAGRALEVLNVSSGENALFDRALGWLVAPHLPGDRALGAGLGPAAGAPRRVDLRIDDEAHRAALADLGHAIPAADRRVCHWSVYLRPGLFDLYRAVLTGTLPLARLAAALPALEPPRPAEPMPWPADPLPLPRGEAS